MPQDKNQSSCSEPPADPTHSSPGQSRRQFLAVSSVTMAAAAVAQKAADAAEVPAKAWRPMTAKSYSNIVGANDQIRLGVIGTGGMGGGHINHFMRDDGKLAKATNVAITALSDVFTKRLDGAKAATHGEANTYANYQDLLSSGDVDAVIIAAPEHWHAQMAHDAIEAGIDMYLEKPMTRTYAEAHKLFKALTASDRVFQLGSQYMQTPAHWRAKELVEKGSLGRVVMAQTSYHRNSLGGEWNYGIDKECKPGTNLDWKSWLGPLPDMEYDPEYYFRWRKYKRFSGGIITDLLPHKVHAIAYLLGVQFPKSVSCMGGIYVHPDRTVADTVAVNVDYGDYVLVVTGATSNEQGLSDMVKGHQATLSLGGGSIKITPERPFTDELDPLSERAPAAEWGSQQEHLKEFCECVRSREKTTWHPEEAFKVMTAIAMMETSLLEKRTVHFDEKTMEIS